MVTRLRLFDDIEADETFASFVGGLCDMNFQPSTNDFCLDMRTTFQAVASGRPEAIATIAGVSRSNPEALRKAAFSRMDNRTLVYRGQNITLHARSPKTVRYCPACLVDDMESAARRGQRRPQNYVHGRAHWICLQYRTCTRHNMALAAVPVPSGQQHDFIGAIRPLLHGMADIARRATRRPASGLDGYVERRMRGTSNEYLDAFGFSVSVKFCEMLGAVALFGPWPPHLGFGDEQWHIAGAAGYDIASHGAEAIRTFLAGIKKVEKRDSREGAHGDWGILYNWMEDTRDPQIEPLLELARNLMEATYPIGAGQRILHKKVKERRMHSIWSASVEHDIHVDVLRNQLSSAGVIVDDPDKFDNQILFPAPDNKVLLERLARGVSALHARERINCERQVLPVLVEAGILSPIVSVETGYPLFDIDDLDLLVAKLSKNANLFASKPAHLESIASARMRAGCSQADIVKLLLGNRLAHVGKLEGVDGYAAILVDPTEIEPLVRGEELGGIVVTHITTDLGIPHAGLVKMLDKQLPTAWRMHPKRRCLQQVVDQQVYEEFKSKYVSLRDLSRAAGINHRRFAVHLRDQGIEPEPGFPDAVHLYRRDKLK